MVKCPGLGEAGPTAMTYDTCGIHADPVSITIGRSACHSWLFILFALLSEKFESVSSWLLK